MSNVYRECNFFNVIEYSSSVRIYDRVDEYSNIKKFDSLEDIFKKYIDVEFVKDWFNEDIDVPYMSQVYSIKNEKRKLLPGITHIDGTGRLQTISEKQNYLYYNLIENFYKKTGIPIILNTSFNENEPIVLSPDHAIDCFLRTNMDLLVLSNWVISR